MDRFIKQAKVFEERIFSLSSFQDFKALALDLFQFQYRNNKPYRDFCDYISPDAPDLKTYEQIPHLPISFFKTHRIQSGDGSAEMIFESSRTTGTQASKHYVHSLNLYQKAYLEGFKRCYGDPAKYVFMALLPFYLQRKNASLVHMAHGLIQASGHEQSGFYLDDLPALAELLVSLNQQKQPVILLGVSFALLDLADAFPMNLNSTTIIETGGMKGRRREWIREELHAFLRDRFPGAKIHSEYGMTELLSQAYATESGHFKSPPWMRISIRDMEDPLAAQGFGRTGGVNITDLANIYSCAFIATDDLGRQYEDGSFEILGRFDYSDIRGCNLMVL